MVTSLSKEHDVSIFREVCVLYPGHVNPDSAVCTATRLRGHSVQPALESRQQWYSVGKAAGGVNLVTYFHLA